MSTTVNSFLRYLLPWKLLILPWNVLLNLLVFVIVLFVTVFSKNIYEQLLSFFFVEWSAANTTSIRDIVIYVTIFFFLLIQVVQYRTHFLIFGHYKFFRWNSWLLVLPFFVLYIPCFKSDCCVFPLLLSLGCKRSYTFDYFHWHWQCCCSPPSYNFVGS